MKMAIEMATIESIKGFVQMGMGVAIVPRMCVKWEIERGWMKELKIRQLNMPRHVYLVSRRGARLPHAAAELMRILKQERTQRNRARLSIVRYAAKRANIGRVIP